jgi:hypothetical protein
MNNNRYNSFNHVHKGLRVMLYTTAEQMQQTDMSKETLAAPVLEQVEEVLYLFESHAHGEDHHFNEPLEQSYPEVATLFEKEHEEDHRLAAVLTHLIAAYRMSDNDSERATRARELFYAFNEFIAFNLYHMNKEEIELNAVLWEKYSDQEIRMIEQTLVQSIPPQKMMKYAKWMIRGINDTEIIHWLSEVKAFAPAPVFEMLINIAEVELPTQRYQVVADALNYEIKAA